MFKHPLALSVALVFSLICGGGIAHAAAAKSGPTRQAIAALTRGTATAYDSINKVYLVVGSHGVLRGRFVSPDGTPIGAPFTIQANPANFAHFPRVAFSPHADGGAGGFLVTWHEGAPSPHARMVSLGKGGAYGPDTQLAGDISWWEAGAPVAYSTQSQEFLVAWRSLPVRGAAPYNDIHAIRLDNNATPKGAVMAITNDVHYQDNPSIAYNSATDEFMIVFAGYNDAARFAFVDSQRVKAGGNVNTGAPVRLVQTGGTYITDVSYNAASNTFLAAWYSLPAGAASARVLNADGSLSGNIITLSTRYKAYDALSIAYNGRTDTFLMVSHGTTAEDGAVELTTAGTPVDNGFIVTSAGGTGNFYPRVTASTDDPNWLVSTANNFTSAMTQVVTGTAVAGTPTSPTTPTTPTSPTTPAPLPPVSAPTMNVDTPGNTVSVSSAGFQVAGWAIDRGAPSGSGIDAIHVYAWPTAGGSPTFLGAATYGIARPDVGGFYGAAFSSSGFSLLASGLPVGTYDLVVYAHSTVSGSFDARARRITVTAPVSIPFMWIDTPAQNSDPSQNLTIAGWALDVASTTSSGVDAIHIYAYPAGSSTPVFLGVAAYGQARPDVGGAFGGSRFSSSGFRLFTTALERGAYTIVVFAHSSVTGTFNNAQTVNITVR